MIFASSAAQAPSSMKLFELRPDSAASFTITVLSNSGSSTAAQPTRIVASVGGKTAAVESPAT